MLWQGEEALPPGGAAARPLEATHCCPFIAHGGTFPRRVSTSVLMYDVLRASGILRVNGEVKSGTQVMRDGGF